MGTLLPFVLLIAALALFLVSTNQWKLWMRGGVVATGFVLLIGAAIANQGHGGDILQSLTNFGGSSDSGSVASHWELNKDEIAGYVLSMVDLFVLIGGLLGIIAIVAFTPGEALERALRPFMIGLVGAVLGGALASFVIGIGLNSPPLRPTLISLEQNDIRDGDTIAIPQRGVKYPVHLEGIDAPELGQVCWAQMGSDCGAVAKSHLWEIVRGAGLLSCRFTQDDGPPTATCTGTGPNGPVDIGRQMLIDGFALGAGNAPDPSAQAAYKGLLGQCTLAPSEWRRMSATARLEFSRDWRRRPVNAPTMGYCRPAVPNPTGRPPVLIPPT